MIELSRGCLKMILKNRFETAPLLFGTCQEKTTKYTKKQHTKPKEQVLTLKKCTVFLFLYAVPPPGTNRWFPNRPYCLHFMVQFQYAKSHAHKILFYSHCVEQSHWFIWIHGQADVIFSPVCCIRYSCFVSHLNIRPKARLYARAGPLPFWRATF